MHALAPIASLACTLIGAWAATSCGDGLGGILISSEQEVEMGVAVDQQLHAEYRIATPDDPATVWMQQFIGRLVESSRTFRDPAEIGGYKVAIIADDNLVNAFAAPGGFTYISTGLILQASSCGEIAGVMGHELAHVTERHGVKMVAESYAVGTITGWFLGEGMAADVAEGLYAFFANTQFSQDHETEADMIGLQIAYGAGYNPYGLADFFARLLALEGGTFIPTFLSTHPATQDRINAVGQEIERRYGAQVDPGTTQTYECVGTTLTLAALKSHIASGHVSVIAGTGTRARPR